MWHYGDPEPVVRPTRGNMGGTARTLDEVDGAIDLGTGGPKTAYVALSGEVLDHEHRRVELQTLPGGGAVEDPDAWWDAVVASAGTAAAASGARGVAGIGCAAAPVPSDGRGV